MSHRGSGFAGAGQNRASRHRRGDMADHRPAAGPPRRAPRRTRLSKFARRRLISRAVTSLFHIAKLERHFISSAEETPAFDRHRGDRWRGDPLERGRFGEAVRPPRISRAATLTLLLVDDNGQRHADPQPLPQRTPFSEVFAQLAAQLVGVVVNISTTQARPRAGRQKRADARAPGPSSQLDEFFRDFFSDKGLPGGQEGLAPPAASLGSGFIIDPSGLIVTNNHVIANADQITVTLSDNTALTAHVVGRDPISDLALLKDRRKDAAAGRAMGRFDACAGWRLGARHRQPVRARRHCHLRHHLGDGARHPFRPV